jgi:hypothetical protein
MSFRQDDLDKNISAIAGDMPVYAGTARETEFDYGTPSASAGVTANAWYARLASLRGQGFGTGALADKSGDLYEIGYNARKGRRALFVGPQEMGRQRYLLLSFMFEDGPTLPLPSAFGSWAGSTFTPGADYTYWFNSLYEHTWGETASPPVYTSGSTDNTGWGFSGSDSIQAAWSVKNARGRSFAERVVAERIVQPRYFVTVNNNSPRIPASGTASVDIEADRVYVYGNMFVWTDWMTSSTTGTPPSPGVSERIDARESPSRMGNHVDMIPRTGYGFLEGRRVVIVRQRNALTPIPTSGDPVVSVLINENITYTAQ